MAINGLEFCAERLQANHPETIIPKAELDLLRNEADQMVEMSKKSENVPRKLKMVLFDLLQAVRRAIDEYQFRGTRELRKELFVIVAQLQEHWGLVEAAKSTEEVGRFLKIIRKLDELTAFALKVKELANESTPYIPLLAQAIGVSGGG